MDFTDYNFDYYNGGNGGGGGGAGDPTQDGGMIGQEDQLRHSSSSASSSRSSSSDLLTNYKCVLLNYPVNTTTYSLVSYYSLWFTNPHPLYPPTDFTPIHHLSFQVSQLILLVYLTVSTQVTACTLLLLASYSTIQLLWGLLVLKSVDFLFWNSLNLLVILIQYGRLCCCGIRMRGTPNSRRIKSASKSILVSPSSRDASSAPLGSTALSSGKNNSSEIEVIYNKLFAPVRVSYKQFMRVVSCKRGFKNLGCGENYAIEKRTRVDSLGLLVAGRLVVSQGGKALHVILPFQFVDSPEYFGVATDELFQVTITALEESKLLVWHRDKLRLTIMNDEFLRVIFDHIIGRDVVRKLIQVSDTIMTTTTTTSCTTPSLFTTSPSGLSPTSPSHNSNGGSSIPSTSLLTSLNSSSSGQQSASSTTTTTTTTQPIIMLRKDKYAYQPTYLTSLSEERSCVNGGSPGSGGIIDVVGKVVNGFGVEEDEEEEDEDEEEDDDEEEEEEEEEGQQHSIEPVSLICGNEKEPMLAATDK